MRYIISGSASKASTDKIDVVPFLLNTETENSPSFFEVLVLIKDVRYRYGFEVDSDSVHAEWLFKCEKKKEVELFTRINDQIDISKYYLEGKGIEQRTRENALFLSIVDQFNGEISKMIMEWFNSYYIVSGLKHEMTRGLTLRFLKLPHFKKQILDFIKGFSLGFNDLNLSTDDIDADHTFVTTHHNKYNSHNELVGTTEFLLSVHESSGTNKLFDMAGYIWVGLFLGRTVIIDELDAKLHPLISQKIVRLFNDPASNPNNAQLIFATHDTNLLNYSDFRRDQIYFTEKDQYGATDLYSLAEYKDENNIKPRKDNSFEKDYIKGRYGAIPFLGDFKNIFTNG